MSDFRFTGAILAKTEQYLGMSEIHLAVFNKISGSAELHKEKFGPAKLRTKRLLYQMAIL